MLVLGAVVVFYYTVQRGGVAQEYKYIYIHEQQDKVNVTCYSTCWRLRSGPQGTLCIVPRPQSCTCWLKCPGTACSIACPQESCIHLQSNRQWLDSMMMAYGVTWVKYLIKSREYNALKLSSVFTKND